MKEIWKVIEECPGYEVSDTGKIRNSKTGRILKPEEIKRPRCQSVTLRVTLSNGGKISRKLVHRIVADAFIPNPAGLPFVEHINGDFQDNRADNLRWSDRASIMQNKHIARRVNENNPRLKKK